MRLRELIQQLEDIHRERGDLEVFTEDHEQRVNPVNGVGIDESDAQPTVSIYVD